jgi:tetratricopeptide (TPR) repeat protein
MAFLSILESPAFAKARPEPREKEINLATASFKEIIDRYVFIADFNQKPAERPVTTEYMWKYPFKPGPVKFELDLNTQDMRKMVYQIKGGGPKTEIFNIGRVAFMEGDYDRAHEVWLQGRQAFKDDAVTNRAFEFFLGINALTIYKTRLDAGKGQAGDEDSKKYLQRAGYFLAAAFILRKDAKEERVSEHAAWGLYNLAVIYYKFDRIPSAYGAATEGLSALLSQGKTSHRTHFRQLLAEAHIRNQDLISAIQELDTAIRQDPDPREAARMFNRSEEVV